MSKSDKPEGSAADDTLSDVLGDQLASKLRRPSDPSPLPGPAPWDVGKTENVPETPPLSVPVEEEVSEPRAAEQASGAEAPSEDTAVEPAAVEQATPAVSVGPVDPNPGEVAEPEAQPQGSSDVVDPRGTEEILAEVMPIRRFGKKHAEWAGSELWPRLRRFPAEVLYPRWRRMCLWADAVRLRVWAWPRRVKVAVGVAVVCVVAAVLILSLVPGSNRQFVQQPTWLSSGPSLEGEEFPRAGVLQPREPVTVLEVVGSLALVVDSVGRAGYVAHGALGDVAPLATSEQPFSRCGRLPGEAASSACESRAETQRVECLQSCEGVVDIAACTGNCEMRSNQCVAGCADAVVPVLPAGSEEAVPSQDDSEVTELDEQPAAVEEEAGSAEVTPAVETEAVSPKPAPKKKDRKKRRRRSRKKR